MLQRSDADSVNSDEAEGESSASTTAVDSDSEESHGTFAVSDSRPTAAKLDSCRSKKTAGFSVARSRGGDSDLEGPGAEAVDADSDESTTAFDLSATTGEPSVSFWTTPWTTSTQLRVACTLSFQHSAHLFLQLRV